MNNQTIDIVAQIKDVLRTIFTLSDFPDEQVTVLTEKAIVMFNKRILLKSIEALEREHRDVVIKQINSLLNTKQATDSEQRKLITTISTNLDPASFTTIVTTAVEDLIHPLLTQFSENSSKEQTSSLKAKLSSIIKP